MISGKLGRQRKCIVQQYNNFFVPLASVTLCVSRKTSLNKQKFPWLDITLHHENRDMH